MEEIGNDPATIGGSSTAYQWWTTASATQLGWGIYSFRKGCCGDGRLMPLKAFGVASLFVGAGATAAVAVLTAHGIRSVKDCIEVGASIRTALGVRPRAPKE